MNGKNHFKIAVTAGIMGAVVTGATSVSLAQTLIAPVVSGYAGLLPDIDSKKSEANKLLKKVTPILGAPALLFGLFNKSLAKEVFLHPSKTVIGLLLLGLFIVIGKNAGHRKFTHRFYGFALFAIAVNMINPVIGQYAIYGYVSHLFADSLTVAKLDFLKPFIPLKFGIALCGGKNDKHDVKQNSVTNTLIIIMLVYSATKLSGLFNI